MPDAEAHKNRNLLKGARAYLSGPMDFVACRSHEKTHGWRNRTRQFLNHYGVTVFNPWYKPAVRGLGVYGEEDPRNSELKALWTFASGPDGARARAQVAEEYSETVHIDLRMVDISDFIVAYCPTHIYSVGTPHEIIVATQQHKPVLFVSPPVEFPALERLRRRADGDPALGELLEQLRREVPIHENPRGIPSLWYAPIVGSENFVDGFGFHLYQEVFGWEADEPMRREIDRPPLRPLLPFLERLAQGHYPRRWDPRTETFRQDKDWLLLEDALEQGRSEGQPGRVKTD